MLSAACAVTLGRYECEDCGDYESGSAQIAFSDGRLFTLECDGHFGAEWDGTDAALARFIFGLAGFRALINGEPSDDEPCADSGQKDNTGSAIWLPASAASGVAVSDVDIDLVHAGDDPHYPTPIRASWTGADGAPRSHDFVQGEWGPFWIELCESLVETETSRETAGDSDY